MTARKLIACALGGSLVTLTLFGAWAIWDSVEFYRADGEAMSEIPGRDLNFGSHHRRVTVPNRDKKSTTKEGFYLYVGDLIDVTMRAVVTQETGPGSRLQCVTEDEGLRTFLAPYPLECTLVSRAIRQGDLVTRDNVERLPIASVVATDSAVPWVRNAQGTWSCGGAAAVTGQEMVNVSRDLVVLRVGASV